MKHLFVCREYPPAAYLPGGIGTYVRNIAEYLAGSGEVVHVIAHRWPGAPRLREDRLDGRLIIHRVALDEPIRDPWALEPEHPGGVQRAMVASAFPSQAFAWQAALLAERLVEFEDIDVIEAQEWEAPLYYLQLRRASGLGPARKPPCVVHLHSPTERITAANAWNTAVADYAAATAMEAYSIVQADALLAPSRFIAAETAARHGFPPSRVTVIPYPLGQGAPITRSADTWTRNTVCHVGRLEPRKGVLEWAEAVARVAEQHPSLRAEFAGGDTAMSVTGGPTVRHSMLGRIPPSRRGHLVFHGNLGRIGLEAVLARASLAVVPSRWENFPNSCMELMGSGLPVIASPHGGMTEMLEDGVSGWIAADASPAGLAAALERALATPPEQRKRMGEAAAESIRGLCGNADIVRRHLEFKGSLVAATDQGKDRGWIDEIPARNDAGAGPIPILSIGQRWDRATPPPGEAIAFASAGIVPSPRFATEMAGLFAQNPGLAVATAWLSDVRDGSRIYMPDCPGAPQIWFDGRPYPLILLRSSLLAGLPANERPSQAVLAAIAGEALAAGGSAMVFPAVLASYRAVQGEAPDWARASGRSAMALSVLRPHLPLPRWLALCPAEMYSTLARNALGGIARRIAAPAPPPGDNPPTGRSGPAQRQGEPGLVSVIVAAYNAAPHIEATLASALSQTWRRLEIIVVDDGSTDDTAALVARAAETDPRVRLLRQRNRGVAAARNRALRYSRGEYIAPLDADDLWAPTKLERQIRCLEAGGPEVGFVYCWWAWIDEGNRVLDRSPRWRVEGRVLEKLLEVNFAGNASVPLFRRSPPTTQGGYDSRLRDLAAQGCEDWDLLLRMAEHHTVACVPEILVGYRRQAGSMSSSCMSMWRSGRRVIAELAARQPGLSPRTIRRGLGQLALHLAGVAFWSGRRLEACAWALRSLAPGMILGIAPHVLRLLIRRPAVSLAQEPPAETDCFTQAAGLEPLIPYDEIHARRWRDTP